AHRERRAVRRGHADRGGASDGHVADRERDLGGVVELQPDLFCRKPSLVEKAQPRSLAIERAEDRFHAQGPGATASAAPCRRGSATASVAPLAKRATAWTRPMRPGTGSRALTRTVCPFASSAETQAGSKASFSTSRTSGLSC